MIVMWHVRLRMRDARPRELVAEGRKGRVRRVVLDGEPYGCDLVVASGGRQPAYSLLAQAGARIEYDESLGVFGLVEMVVFIATVFVAYAYVWRRGGLDWD